MAYQAIRLLPLGANALPPPTRPMTMSLDTAIKPGTPEDDAARADAPGLEVSQAREPKGLVAQFGLDEPLAMDAGVQLAPFQIAYQTAGTLNAARSNAVLICHALTGDQHFAHTHPVTGKRGWWETLVGPGKPVDTDRYFVICSNVVGSCMGSTGPASIDPATNRAYGLDFIPIHTERYDLVLTRASLKFPPIAAFLNDLQRAPLRRKLEVLADYDTRQTGELR